MRAILINPMLKTVSRFYDEFEDQRIVQFYVQSHVTTSLILGPGHLMIVDEFGIFRADQHWFGIKDQPVAIAGRGLILGRPVEPDGSVFTSCQLEEGAVRNLIRWFDNPAEAEAMVPPTKVTTKPGGRGKVLKQIPAQGFRTMKKELITRDGKVMPYVPTA